MPIKSERQRRWMNACRNPKFRKKSKSKCPPESVLVEYLGHKKKNPKYY